MSIFQPMTNPYGGLPPTPTQQRLYQSPYMPATTQGMYGNQSYYGGSQQIANGINWVQGIEGAKAYSLIPNSNTVLFDSDNDGIFYIKTCDAQGMCNLRTFDYTERNAKPTNIVALNPEEYVTRKEYNELLKALSGKVDNNEPTIQSNDDTAINK